jgi:hypothetical protein
MLSSTTNSLARGLGQLQRPRPVGRADGRRRAAPCRLPRGCQLPQAHGRGRRGHGHPRLHVPACRRVTCCSWTSSSPWPRTSSSSMRPPRPSARRTEPRSCATFAARVRELAKREYASTDDRSQCRQRSAVRSQRDDQRVHPRERQRAHREAMASKVVICSPLTLFAFSVSFARPSTTS